MGRLLGRRVLEVTGAIAAAVKMTLKQRSGGHPSE